MSYIPSTDADQREMLKKIGVERFQDLLRDIPEEMLYRGALDLPEPMSELEVRDHLADLAKRNAHNEDYICFLGGGAYDHYIPAAIGQLLARSEFYTAYTPYQPEVSQGTLQAIYEYQSMICELTGMEVCNASLYDGGSALAEGMLLACAHTRRVKVAVSSSLHPHYRRILETYARGRQLELIEVSAAEGATDIERLADTVDDETAAVVVQHPNFFGVLEQMPEISEITHRHGGLLITSNDPISLALLQPPSSYGTDIVTAEGQSLGVPLSFGGPYLGIFATTRALMRKMPGRMAGETTDQSGRRGYVLTLQTREQHIRREKATSNICTNQGLVALAATIYLALLGKNGLVKVAELCMQKSHYLANKINSLEGFRLKYGRPFFKEFVVESRISPERVMSELRERKKIFAGIPLQEMVPEQDNAFLCAVTEKRTRKQMDDLIDSLKELFPGP